MPLEMQLVPVTKRRAPRQPDAPFRLPIAHILTHPLAWVPTLMFWAIVLWLAFLGWHEYARAYYILLPPSLPASLIARGYSAEILRNLIRRDIDNILSTTVEPRMTSTSLVSVSPGEAPDIRVPGFDLPLPVVTTWLRSTFATDSLLISISILEGPSSYTHQVSFGQGHSFAFAEHRDSITHAVHHIAENLIGTLRPVSLAAYYYAIRDTAKARRFALTALPSPDSRDRSRAHNILGALDVLGRHNPAAQNHFADAITEDVTFPSPYLNWAAAILPNDAWGARRFYSTGFAFSRLPGPYLGYGTATAYNGIGLSLRLMDSLDASVAYFDSATATDSAFLPGYINAAAALMRANAPGEALLRAERAAKLAPDEPEALKVLADALARTASLDSASKVAEHLCMVDSTSIPCRELRQNAGTRTLRPTPQGQ
jgi:tetratricopeptide (TPR) repeat protein